MCRTSAAEEPWYVCVRGRQLRPAPTAAPEIGLGIVTERGFGLRTDRTDLAALARSVRLPQTCVPWIRCNKSSPRGILRAIAGCVQEMHAGTARRGRPYQATSNRAVRETHSRHHLVGWLLRANRLLGSRCDYFTTRRFARAFVSRAQPLAVSPSTISRWETSHVRAPYRAVHRYEELLDLPIGQLTSTIDIVHRYWALSATPAPRLSRPEQDIGSGHGLQGLLDQACGTATMTGMEWDDLTVGLTTLPRPLAPRRVWDEISGRLVSEMIISNDVAWNQRFEALNRLLVHPAIQQSAIAACASLASDRSNLIFIEVISALDSTNHKDASRHVLAQLRNPTNDRALVGALLACVRKVQRRHFTLVELRYIAAVTAELLSHTGAANHATTLARELLRTISPGVHTGLAAHLARRVYVPSTVGNPDAESATEDFEGNWLITNGVVNAATTAIPDTPWVHDDILARLVHDTLFHPILDVRFYAALLIKATPYRKPIADALSVELKNALGSGRTGFAIVLVDALRTLGGPAQRLLLETITLSPSVPRAVSESAAFAVGHVPSVDEGSTYWVNALQHHAGRQATSVSNGNGSILSGLVYGIGIARHDRLLTALRTDFSLPFEVRSAASWWLSFPEHIYLSAAHDPNG